MTQYCWHTPDNPKSRVSFPLSADAKLTRRTLLKIAGVSAMITTLSMDMGYGYEPPFRMYAFEYPLNSPGVPRSWCQNWGANGYDISVCYEGTPDYMTLPLQVDSVSSFGEVGCAVFALANMMVKIGALPLEGTTVMDFYDGAWKKQHTNGGTSFSVAGGGMSFGTIAGATKEAYSIDLEYKGALELPPDSEIQALIEDGAFGIAEVYSHNGSISGGGYTTHYIFIDDFDQHPITIDSGMGVGIIDGSNPYRVNTFHVYKATGKSKADLASLANKTGGSGGSSSSSSDSSSDDSISVEGGSSYRIPDELDLLGLEHEKKLQEIYDKMTQDADIADPSRMARVEDLSLDEQKKIVALRETKDANKVSFGQRANQLVIFGGLLGFMYSVFLTLGGIFDRAVTLSDTTSATRLLSFGRLSFVDSSDMVSANPPADGTQRVTLQQLFKRSLVGIIFSLLIISGVMTGLFSSVYVWVADLVSGQ